MGLSNEQYNMIMRDYQRRQTQSRTEQARRQEEIYARFPEFSEIDREIAALSTACARRLLADDGAASSDSDVRKRTADAELAALRAQIDKLSARRAALLSSGGYPQDYLAPRYHCPDCQDTGYIGAEKCHCFRQASIDLLYTQSNLKEILETENFSTFSLEYYSDERKDPVTELTAAQTARRALEECRRFTERFDQTFENIFLYGDTGLGKTFLSHCIAKELLESTHSVIYFSSFRLFELFADSAFGRSGAENAAELEHQVFDCDFLIIDDLGTELVNSFVASQLFHVLNERILRRKSTLISTNLSLGTFADTYSERVFSRISSNYTMLKLIGDDIRLRKKISAGKA